MAKLKGPRSHTRAARRQGAPALDLDKAFSAPERPRECPRSPDDILAARHGANISKKNKQKPLSRQQRLRREKGMARASTVVEQLEAKIRSSKERMKRTKNRSADWEDLNAGLRKRQVSDKGAKAHLKIEKSGAQMEFEDEKDTNDSDAGLAAGFSDTSKQESPHEVDELNGIT